MLRVECDRGQGGRRGARLLFVFALFVCEKLREGGRWATAQNEHPRIMNRNPGEQADPEIK